MTLESEHAKLLSIIEEYKIQYEEFQGGKKAAAARARKQLSLLTKSAKQLRSDISDKKNKMSKKKGGAKRSKKKSCK